MYAWKNYLRSYTSAINFFCKQKSKIILYFMDRKALMRRHYKNFCNQ